MAEPETRVKPCAIVGWQEGNAGQIHSWLENQGQQIACFVHPEDKQPTIEKIHRDACQFSYPENNYFKDKPLICSSQWSDELRKLGITKVLITTDDMQQRHAQIEQARAAGFQLINAIHPTVTMMDGCIIGKNVIIHARAFIGYRAEIEDGVIINTGAQIDHHNVIRTCATIDPGVILAGNVTVGRYTRVHTAAVAKNKIRIGENSIIGAGTVIIEDVPDEVTVVGVPGRIIKRKGKRI